MLTFSMIQQQRSLKMWPHRVQQPEHTLPRPPEVYQMPTTDTSIYYIPRIHANSISCRATWLIFSSRIASDRKSNRNGHFIIFGVNTNTSWIHRPRGRLHLEHFVWEQLSSFVYEHAAVNLVLEEEQGLYYVTEQVRYSYALKLWRNSVVFEVSSFLLVLNEGHDRLSNSVSPIAEMTIFAMDVVLWCNFPPSE